MPNLDRWPSGIWGLIPIVGLLVGCATAVPKNPDTAQDMLQTADAAYERKDWIAAEMGYRALAERVPEDAYAFIRWGNTLARQGRLDEASVVYQEALIRDGTLAKTHYNLALVRLLQAEAALIAASKNLPRGDPMAAHTEKLLTHVKRITHLPTREPTSPALPPKPPLPR